MSTITPTRWHSFRCHVVRMHYWTTMRNPDGDRYQACALCGRERSTFVLPPVGLS